MTKLFDEFDGVSAKQWKQKIQMDLKGADYNDTLIWNTAEGIDVKPFYHPDDFNGEFTPTPHHPASWQVVQDFYIDDEVVVNKLATDALERGAQALYLSANKAFDPTVLFKDIDLNNLTIYFELRWLESDFISGLIKYLSDKNADAHYQIDLLGNLARSGNWFKDLKTDHEALDNIVNAFPEASLLGVDSGLYQNAGANVVQQLAYSMGHANEYLNHFKDKGDLKLTFKVAVGSNYFFEIAKIRALRKLFATLAAEYGFSSECNVLVVPSRRNKTIFDYNMNMLRTTTECMSAVLGGADAICNQAYDHIYHKSNEFGERISRNQLLILKSESYFGMVENPADGTYYIESLTEQLAKKALELFKEIESSGGFLQRLMDGTIQRKIKENAAKEQAAFDEEQLVLIGTNKYPNQDDRMKDQLEILPFVKIDPRKTLIEPIIEKRLAENIEKERLENEN